MSVISASAIAVRFQKRPVLDNVSFACEAGTVTCIVGENGAGKSTLLKVLSGQLQPASGKVQFNAHDVQSMGFSERARFRAVLPQQPSAALGITAHEVVSLGLHPHPKPTSNAVDEALELVDARHFASRSAESLSGGERQRVELARVFAQVLGDGRPEGRFLLLDEPTAALDVRQVLLVTETLVALTKRGIGLILSIHDLTLATSLADQLVVMSSGRLLHAGRNTPAVMEPLEEAFRVKFEARPMLSASLLS